MKHARQLRFSVCWPIIVCAGVLSAHLFRSVPPQPALAVLCVIPLTGVVFRQFRAPALYLASMCWALVSFQDILDARPTRMQDVSLEGRVISVPEVGRDHTRFLFKPMGSSSEGPLPEKVLATWYRERPELGVGDSWSLDIRLKPPWGSVNFQGSDTERWLFTQKVDALATVRQGRRINGPSGFQEMSERLREHVGRTVGERLQTHPMAGVVLALATADRSNLDRDQRTVLRQTGTAHLLAISGLHVGLAAAGGLWFGRLAAWLLGGVLPLARTGVVLPLLSIGCSLACATLYAFLAALQVSTVRALGMLAIFLIALARSRCIHPGRALVLALTVVLLLDPAAPASAGAWFSFLAVAALLAHFIPRPVNGKGLMTLVRAQWAVMLVLTPVSAYWFQSYSLSGLVANLVAIPWVSLSVVPPVLMGVASLPLESGLSGFLWWCAAESSSALFVILRWLSQWQGLYQASSVIAAWQLALALLGGFLLLLPGAFRLRYVAVALLLPVFLPAERVRQPGGLVVEVLDAGQGTAAIVSTAGHSLLYDTGPGDGVELSVVDSTVLPALKNGYHQRSPELVIISHGDLDHAGGLGVLRRRFPHAEYLANTGRALGDLCHFPLAWRRGDLQFQVLHPSIGLPYLKNDSSCVVSVSGPTGSVLLSGDISATIEQRLVAEGLMPHDLLLVPHHGSRSSSSSRFIQAVRPRAAAATTRLGNRFGFPRPDVVERYQSAGISFLSTAACGALRFRFSEGGKLSIESARRTRQRIWRWPAESECP